MCIEIMNFFVLSKISVLVISLTHQLPSILIVIVNPKTYNYLELRQLVYKLGARS